MKLNGKWNRGKLHENVFCYWSFSGMTIHAKIQKFIMNHFIMNRSIKFNVLLSFIQEFGSKRGNAKIHCKLNFGHKTLLIKEDAN